VCVSGGYLGPHEIQFVTYTRVISAIFSCHGKINPSPQDPRLAKKKGFQFTRLQRPHRAGNCRYLHGEWCFWDRKQKGGDAIEGIDLLEATGGRPVSSGAKAYLT